MRGEMDFEPINEDHAIEEVVLGCNLGRRISAGELRALLNLHSRVSEELPAASIENEPLSALQFAYLRPNGTATWTLQVVENNIIVVCTRYSRWAKVWETSKRYMSLALSALENKENTDVAGFTLAVTDKFKANKENNDLSTLLIKNEWMMPVAFGMEGAWHNHVGWFDESKSDWKILNHLNIDCRFEVESEDSKQKAAKNIVIRHSQQCKFKDPPKLANVDASDGPLLNLMPSYLHECNKAVLNNLLSEEMKSRIHLQGEA